MMSSKETVATAAEALCGKLGLTQGDKAFVMINGCGAATTMELLILFKDTVEFLKAKGVETVGSMVGEILTVQEAGGFQMNIAKWDEETLRLWNTPCHTPAYSKDLIKDINLNKLFIVENADGKLEIIKDEGITIE